MAKETISQTEGLCKEVANCIRNAYDRGYKQGQKDMEQDTMSILENGKMIGRVEAWECCRKLFATMPEKDIEQAFYTEWHNGGFNALMNLDVTDAIRRVEEYEKKKKDDAIKVGDEVYIIMENYPSVVTCVFSESGLDNPKAVHITGSGKYAVTPCSQLHKTGRHFDCIAEVLERLKEVQDETDRKG